MSASPWRLSHRYHRPLVELANRHYPRQKRGTPQCIAPGTYLALISDDRTAGWVTRWPEFSQHAWAGAWENSLFRKEGPGRASDMIRHAVAHTRDKWPEIPGLGMITFVNPGEVRSTNPGYCYIKAGFRRVGRTRKGLLVFQLDAARMPGPAPVPGTQMSLFGGAS